MGLFAYRDYRHLFAAQVVALLGTGLATVALALLAFDLAGPRAGSVLGTALAIKMVAYVVVAPVAGAYADRVPRRLALVALDLARALVVLALPFVSAVWHIYVLIFVLQAASAAFTPTFQAVIPDLLRDERDYTRALSASQLAVSMETLLSPVVAALVLRVVSFPWLFAGTAAGFVASALLVLGTRIPDAVPSARTAVLDRVSAGVRLFVRTARLRGVLALDLVVAAAGAIVMVNTVNLVRETLGRSESDVALLLAAHGVGTIVVAAALPRLLRRAAERSVMTAGGTVLLGGVAGAIALSVLPGAGMWGWALAVWALLGAGAGMVLTPIGRVLRRESRPEDRPAVFAAQFSLSHACWLITYPVAGWVATVAGFTAAWSALGALALVGAVAARVLWPRSSYRPLGVPASTTH